MLDEFQRGAIPTEPERAPVTLSRLVGRDVAGTIALFSRQNRFADSRRACPPVYPVCREGASLPVSMHCRKLKRNTGGSQDCGTSVRLRRDPSR
jgi:hypothetical protein